MTVKLGPLYNKYLEAALHGVLSNLRQVKYIVNDKILDGYINNISIEFVQQLTDVVTESRSKLYIPGLENEEIRLHLLRIKNNLSLIQIDKINNLWNIINFQIKAAMRGVVNRVINRAERNDQNKEMAKRLGTKIEAFNNILQDYLFEPILQREEEAKHLVDKYTPKPEKIEEIPKIEKQNLTQNFETKNALKEDEIKFTIEDLVQG